MKLMLILIMAISLAEAGVNLKAPATRYGHKIETIEVVKDNKTIRAPAPTGTDPILKTIERQNTELSAILKKKSNLPLIEDNSFNLVTGTVLKGKLLNSVVSTNLESPLLVAVSDSERLSDDTRFACVGTTKHKRVQTLCNLLIRNGKEYEVEVELLNTDGTSGLRGEYYEGREGYVAGMIAAQVGQGLLAVPQARVEAKAAEMALPKAKNQLLQGILSGINEGAETLKGDLNTVEPVVFINAGKEVLIYFKRRFSSEDKKVEN